MFNRAYINELKAENERLKRKKEEYEDEMIKSMNSKKSYKNANIKLMNEIGKLKKDIESKENSVCNVLDSNKELSQENEYFRNKINTLEKLVKWHEENECELNTKLCRSKGQLEKLRNIYKMQTGIDILEGEE